MALELTTANFENEVIKSDIPVLVDFWAEWCGPCRMIAPIVNEISEEMAGQLKVGKVNVDFDPSLAQKYSVRNIPTLLVFKNGEVVDKFIGALPKPQLVNKQTVLKKRMRWDKNNDPYEYVFRDTYSLYRIKIKDLLGDATDYALNTFRRMSSFEFDRNYIYAVQCRCTTTAREYWLMLPEASGLTSNNETDRLLVEANKDAISAIAYTIQVPNKHNIKRIWRQGDIIITQLNNEFLSNAIGKPEPLSKEEYLNLMYSET